MRQHVVKGVLCEKVILDTGSDGHIFPRSVMPTVKEARGLVHGMCNGKEVLTHKGYVPMLGDEAWVPVGGKYLISISMLDRKGCTLTIKSGVMNV